MSSSFSTLSDAVLETLSTILDTLDQLHTVSIEFTVMRENSLPTGLHIDIQCLLAEQKGLPDNMRPHSYVQKED